jgi:hypothetical protein
MSAAIQDLIVAPAVVLSLDMGQGSREQGFAMHPPKRVRFILSEQAATPEPAQPCLSEAADL